MRVYRMNANETHEEQGHYAVHILGGGTVFHIGPHCALSAPAYGTTARIISDLILTDYHSLSHVHLTRMCGALRGPETNEDVAKLVDDLVADPHTKMIFMSVALCDFEGKVVQRRYDGEDLATVYRPSGKEQPRLKSNQEHTLLLTPADKIIGRIRKERKDIFLVGFKTTTGASPDEQYMAGLRLLKNASCNLVLANDLHTKLNMVITPEQARYHETTDRMEALKGLVEMAVLRSKLTFTRANVVPGQPVSWNDPRVPDNLREVVNHCIARGAYKPFGGATVGHFAVKLDDTHFLTSRRKSNFNYLEQTGLVLVEANYTDTVTAFGAKPSVGGQSQRIIFHDHPGWDCIVHFHCPLKKGSHIPVVSQREFECGSHECGKNTSDGLAPFHSQVTGGGYDVLKVVMLDKHGPNIVFGKEADPKGIIEFIEQNFDLSGRTDGVENWQAWA